MLINKHTIPIRNAFAKLLPPVAEFGASVWFAFVHLPRFRKHGFFPPLPYLLKRGILQHAAQRLGLTAFVETGTYLGDTPWYFRKKFKEIHTIEVSDFLAAAAKKRFASCRNVHVHLGDSSVVLPTLVEKLSLPTLFWLDGHYDKGLTGSGKLECPIYSELETIFSRIKVPWAALIDDARNFAAQKTDYPDLDSLRDFVKSRLKSFSMWVENDIIWIVPVAGLDSLASRARGLPQTAPA